MGDGIERAESLLREIATELVRLPLDDRARPLHLRVLSLKGLVSTWSRTPPPPANVEAVLDTLRLLRAHVLEVRATSEVRIGASYRTPRRVAKGR